MKCLLLLFVSLYLLHIPSLLFADDCTDALEEAKSCYEQGDYVKAKALFEYVQAECGDDYGDVVTWISKCANVSHNIVTKDFVVNGVSFKMVYVQGGTFNMGGDRPQQVTVSDYYIAETEVTQALWKAVMGTTIQDEYEEYKKQCEGMNIHLRMHGEGDEHPMYYLSWNECQEFITRLNQLTGKQFRLPTEAEWEFAARGGNRSNGYKYAGSNNVDEVAWYNLINTHPVAQKKPNELGLFDMSGNVGEWCSTKHKGYRVIRGGGHKYYSRYNTITNCMYDFPNSDGPGVGFRLVTQ